ncbi:MAG: type VI secretion system-associated protein TagF [Proteobacteria bacterium]|nr:type VI secretion system-associated protein TagF [Pseudomonadota bacterium]
MPMRCGLFGKLGSKRDFIALATPRKFLEVWEPWMQACLSASRHQLGNDWQTAFLSAPVWRFWLGADICGTSVAGAIMPSLDAVGRYYPLTLHAIADDATSIALPDVDAQDQWYEDAERFLLATLEPGVSFETTTEALERLHPADVQPEADAELARSGNLVGTIPGEDGFAAALAILRSANPEIYAAGTFWWTAGGAGFTPMALSCRGLPDPYEYSILLTGNLVRTATVA